KDVAESSSRACARSSQNCRAGRRLPISKAFRISARPIFCPNLRQKRPNSLRWAENGFGHLTLRRFQHDVRQSRTGRVASSATRPQGRVPADKTKTTEKGCKNMAKKIVTALV